MTLGSVQHSIDPLTNMDNHFELNLKCFNDIVLLGVQHKTQATNPLNEDNTQALDSLSSEMMVCLELINVIGIAVLKTSVSKEVLNTFAQAYPKLMEKEIPSAISNAIRFTTTKGTKNIYSYQEIYFYFDLIKKIFTKLDEVHKDSLSRLSRLMEKTFTKEHAERLEPRQSTLYRKLQETLSLEAVQQLNRSKQSELLQTLREMETCLGQEKRIEYNPCTRYGRAVYHSIASVRLDQYRQLAQELEENLYFSKMELDRCRKTLALADFRITSSVENIHAFIVSKQCKEFSIEKSYIFFNMALAMPSKIRINERSKIQEISDAIAHVNIKTFAASIHLLHENYGGLFLCLAEKFSMLNMSDRMINVCVLEMKLENERMIAKKNAGIDTGWHEVRSSDSSKPQNHGNSKGEGSSRDSELSLESFLEGSVNIRD